MLCPRVHDSPHMRSPTHAIVGTLSETAPTTENGIATATTILGRCSAMSTPFRRLAATVPTSVLRAVILVHNLATETSARTDQKPDVLARRIVPSLCAV